MNSLTSVLETSAVLYLNWKLMKKLYENQFDEIIEPYKREILKKCQELQVTDITTALTCILTDMECSKKDFILYSAAAADIILKRRIPKDAMDTLKPSRN